MDSVKKVFLSFNIHNDSNFVLLVYYYLSRQPGLEVFLYDRHRHGGDLDAEISIALKDAKYFVFFRGKDIGHYQTNEASFWLKFHGNEENSRRFVIELPCPSCWPDEIAMFPLSVDAFKVDVTINEPKLTESYAAKCAKDLAISLTCKWIPYDGVPECYIFDYEKDIIAQFASTNGVPEKDSLKKGCPEKWPALYPREGDKHDTPLEMSDIGSFRSIEDTVLVDVRSKYHKHVHPATDSKKEGDGCCLVEKRLTFLEAGPREQLHYGRESRLDVGILVSGGIAPGINAVIAGIVERHSLYWREEFNNHGRNRPALVIHIYHDGFSGLQDRRYHEIKFANLGDDDPQQNHEFEKVMSQANAGGSMFGTSRCDRLSNRKLLEDRNTSLNDVLHHLWNDNIKILYVIGGDGSMKAAHALYTLNEAMLHDDQVHKTGAKPISIVGIPKTMDNDILWVWQSFGFMSAVEKASECLRLLHTEAVSNPRLCVIQLFGSDSGFTVSHAALASLECDAALIPEMKFDMNSLFDHISRRIGPRLRHTGEQRPYGLVVMAETAVPEDWYCYVNWKEHLQRVDLSLGDFLLKIKDKNLRHAISAQISNSNPDKFTLDLSRDEVEAIITFIENDRRVYGQTPDALRTVSLRLVSQVLQYRIQKDMGASDQYWKTFRVFTSEPRHLLRSTQPSANDIIIGRRFGTLAVDNAMAGYGDFMISQWLTEYVLVPLSLVVLGRKRVPEKGIFWKSVLAKTDQPDMNDETDAQI